MDLNKYFNMLKGTSSLYPTVSTLDNSVMASSKHYLGNKEEFPITNIFSTIATFKNGRKQSGFRGLNVLFCEVDDYQSNIATILPLKPTLLIKSGPNSYHIYWELETTITNLEDAIDEVRKFKDMLLAIKFPIDKGALKVTQILRVPHSLREKDSDHRGKNRGNSVDVVFYNEGLKYSLDDFPIWGRLVKHNLVHKIVHKTKGDRSGTEFAVVIKLVELGASDSLIEKILLHNKVGEKSQERKDSYMADTIASARAVTSIAQAGAERYSETAIEEQAYGLAYLTKNNTTQVTNFIPIGKALMTPANVPDMSNVSDVYYIFEADGVEYTANKNHLDDKRGWKEILSGGSHSLTTSNGTTIDALSMHIKSICEGTGIQPNYTRFAGYTKYKAQYVRVPSHDNDLVYLPTQAKMDILRYDIKHGNGIVTNAEIVTAFSKLNTKLEMYTMLAWITLTFFNELRAFELPHDIKLPIMFISGGSQIGKTTIVDRLFRLFGIPNNNGTRMAFGSSFSLEKALGRSRTIPLFLNEYRSGDRASASVSKALKNLFDGTALEKGTASQNTISYELIRPLIIDGQDTYTNESALISRTVNIHLSADRSKTALAEFDHILDDSNLSSSLHNYVLGILNSPNIVDEIVNHVEGVKLSLSDTSLDGRRKMLLGYMHWGLKLLFEFVGIDVPPVKSLYVMFGDSYNAEADYLFNDASVFLNYVLPRRKPVTRFGKSKTDEYYVFSIAKVHENFSSFIFRTGGPSTSKLSLEATRKMLHNHGGFCEVDGDICKINVTKARKAGLYTKVIVYDYDNGRM